ncbi:hypothetical protein HK096_008572, partial [Nowakowskiella sp. JEL0078]
MMKTKYRVNLLKKYLAMEDRLFYTNESIGINLLEAIEMFSEVWDSCKSQSISNCFAHTGIFPQEQEAFLRNICLDSDERDSDSTKELATILSNLQIAGSTILTAEEYAELDRKTPANDMDEYLDDLNYFVRNVSQSLNNSAKV